MRIVLEHNLANHTRIRDGAGFGPFQVSPSQRLEKTTVNVHPKISLEVIVCLIHVKHTRQHQPLHQLDQPLIATGASNDQMKIGISLNLLTICIDAGLSRLLCFFNDSLKLRKVICGELSEAQLYSEQVESIDKSENFGVVSSRPRTQIQAARRPALDDSDLFQAVKGVSDGRPAYLKSTGEIFLAKSLVWNEFPSFDSIKDSENNPVSECTINGLRREAICFV